MFFKKTDDSPKCCSICGAPDAGFKATDGWICRKCMPVDMSFTRLSVEEVRSTHIKDPELYNRSEIFDETACIGDLHFDDGNKLFFKGPYVNRTIPILNYNEIGGYCIEINGRPAAFNSIDGKRSVFRVRTDEYIRKISREVDTITLDVQSLRHNVRVRQYTIRSLKGSICETKEECIRASMRMSDVFDNIVESNILDNNKLD